MAGILLFTVKLFFRIKRLTVNFPLLNDGHYVGKVKVPVFPTAFAVYKKENWVFSLGFGPNAGGGSADFDRGLPSFEIPLSKLVLLKNFLAFHKLVWMLNVPGGYNADLSFNGSSVYWGIQLGATYKVNDIFSVYGGVTVPAFKKYL